MPERKGVGGHSPFVATWYNKIGQVFSFFQLLVMIASHQLAIQFQQPQVDI
jgi:hypothetical protein